MKAMRTDSQLHIHFEDLDQKVETESQEYGQVPGFHLMTQERNANNELKANKDLIEEIAGRSNLETACTCVLFNAGVGGVDNMEVQKLPGWLAENYEVLANRLCAGKYKPSPVRRVEIPKPEKGKTRKLGIPTVIDRMVQQACVQVLTPIYEPLFSDKSFGFRPGKSAHDALLYIQELANEGYTWVASIDLEEFFDTVNHSKLIQLVSETIKDGRVVSLIHRFLYAGVMENGVRVRSEEGTPQRGPLSPLLANIILNELDQELTHRGHEFVRYADDILILKKTEKAARRTLESISTFVEKKLFLKVNKDKSYVAKITNPQVKYLGYGFYSSNGIQFRAHAKSIMRLKDKIRVILARSNGWSLEYRKYRLKCLVIGWTNYFKLANMKSILASMDEWLRRKIRCVYWKQWKKIRTKLKTLKRLGISKWQAWQWANSRQAYWRVAGCGILSRALNNSKLNEFGWTMLSSQYAKAHC